MFTVMLSLRFLCHMSIDRVHFYGSYNIFFNDDGGRAAILFRIQVLRRYIKTLKYTISMRALIILSEIC